MGFFSWITSDTKEPIRNRYSSAGALPVYLLCPDGTKLYEDNYEGYGLFAGQDAYALLARWNVPERCNGDEDHDRGIGIFLELNPRIKYPLKFVEDGSLSYDDVPASEVDPNQGYYYDEEEEEDEDEDEEEEE